LINNEYDGRSKIRLYNCDCMEFLKNVPDKFYELAIVDPPYGLNITKIWGDEKYGYKQWDKKEWDVKSPDKSYFDELFRVSKNQIIWGANHFITDINKNSAGWIVWDKGQRNFTLADGEMAWTSFDKAMRIFSYSRASANKEERFHINQKPINLYKWILENYAIKGDKILDTHFGSLSIGIACWDMSYNLDACELDPEYYESAKNRLEWHLRYSNNNFFEEV